MEEKIEKVVTRVLSKENKRIDAALIVLNNGFSKPIVPIKVENGIILGKDVNFEPIEINITDVQNIECYSQQMFDIWRNRGKRK